MSYLDNHVAALNGGVSLSPDMFTVPIPDLEHYSKDGVLPPATKSLEEAAKHHQDLSREFIRQTRNRQDAQAIALNVADKLRPAIEAAIDQGADADAAYQKVLTDKNEADAAVARIAEILVSYRRPIFRAWTRLATEVQAYRPAADPHLAAQLEAASLKVNKAREALTAAVLHHTELEQLAAWITNATGAIGETPPQTSNVKLTNVYPFDE